MIKVLPQGLAGKLERLMIPSDSWDQAPMEVENEALINSAQGIPTGLAFYENRWYMIQSGQGPYIAKVWKEEVREEHILSSILRTVVWEETDLEDI